MSNDLLRFRQIHLDFHTHGSIEGIGADFDPKEFADTLVKARVDSINIFALGHHGYIYYDTKRFPEQRHPHLERNLLKEQIKACHERGIRTPIYVSIQVNAYLAERHPEWLVRTPQGCMTGPGYYEPGFWNLLCVNSPYFDYLKELVTDIFESVPVDGFWFDIVNSVQCSCRYCREKMLAAGLDPSDEDARIRYSVEVIQQFKRRMTAHVRKHKADALIYYNAGHIGPMVRPSLDDYTHIELESLPSGWGYYYFPTAARYARTLGRDFVGMTGKFHTVWGDFHSFKPEAALAYECYTMLAMGGKCCIGDQLHPRGRLCEHTYNLIGNVYSEVEKHEPWCTGADAMTDTGVLTPEAFSTSNKHTALPKAAVGAMQMLQEEKQQFDIIDPEAEFSRYKLVILPDEIPVNAELSKKLETYLKNGGKLIASYKSGLNETGDAFALPLGVSYKGDAEFTPLFLKPRSGFLPMLRPTEHVMYLTGAAIDAQDSADVLADNIAPYFNRTWEHYCSHQHAPASGRVYSPAVVSTGNTIYFSHPIFTQYRENAAQWCRQMLADALDTLLPNPLVKIDAPRSLIATLNRQQKQNRLLLHLLHYVPVRNNERHDTVEEPIPLFELPVSLRVDGRVDSVECAPEGEALEFSQENGRLQFMVPKLNGYQIVAIQLA